MTAPDLELLVRRILESMPRGVGEMDADLRRNLRAAVSGALSRMELVTREDFDTQARVLARAREQIDALEQRVRELEARGGDAGEG